MIIIPTFTNLMLNRIDRLPKNKNDTILPINIEKTKPLKNCFSANGKKKVNKDNTKADKLTKIATTINKQNLVSVICILVNGLETTINSVPSSFISLKILITITAENKAIVIHKNVPQIGKDVFAQNCNGLILAVIGKIIKKLVHVIKNNKHVIQIDFFFITFNIKNLKYVNNIANKYLELYYFMINCGI